MTVEKVELVKSTAKAICVKFYAVELKKEITCWLPNQRAKLDGSTLTVTEAMYLEKIDEVRNREQAAADAKKDVFVIGNFKEYEKSFGMRVSVYEYMSEQTVSRMMFIPKKLIISIRENGIVVPQWFFKKKIEEIKEEAATGSFKASWMTVEVETELVDPGYSTPAETIPEISDDAKPATVEAIPAPWELPESESIAACLKCEPVQIERNPYYNPRNTPITHVANLGGTSMIDQYAGIGSGIAFVKENKVVAFQYKYGRYSNEPLDCERVRVEFSGTQICFVYK